MAANPVTAYADNPYAGYVETEQLDGLLEAAGVAGVREILAAFWRSTDGLVAELRAQIARGDQQGAMRSAHALKGSALNVGAVRFADTVRRIEELCKAGDLSAAGAFATTADAEYRQTILAFEDRLSAFGRA
jgi:HPt (histidine-containing phosphotransfer) domain-containing protein